MWPAHRVRELEFKPQVVTSTSSLLEMVVTPILMLTAIGSGWHLRWKDVAYDGSVQVEVLCPRCHDVRLDGTSTTHPPRYVQIDQTPGVGESTEIVTNEDYAAARFTFQGVLPVLTDDCCHTAAISCIR